MKIYSAPLQGYTEAIWRNAHRKVYCGVDAYYTPFVRIERGEFRNKDLRDTDPVNNDVDNLIPQVIASPEDEFERVILHFIKNGYKKIDINMGCPFPLITRKHKGSGILPYPNEVEALMKSISKYSDVEFSLKMRLGFEKNDEWKYIIDIINEARLSKLIVHPRTAKQQYKGDVDLLSFEEIYNCSRNPIVYNGDIKTLDDISRIESQFSGLEGIMIGRGLLANPALAEEYKLGKSIEESERVEKIMSMHEIVFNQSLLIYQEAQVLGKMKTFWEYILPILDKKKAKALVKSNSLKKYTFAVNDLFV